MSNDVTTYRREIAAVARPMHSIEVK